MKVGSLNGSLRHEHELLGDSRRELIREMARWQVCVESNPTSNLVVGGFKEAMAAQKYLQTRPTNKTSLGKETLTWSISTDDPITFSTTLADEYAYAWAGMVLARNRAILRTRAPSWMKRRLRRCGCGLRFRLTNVRMRPVAFTRMESLRVATDEVLARLQANGYYVARRPVGRNEAIRFVLKVGRALGKLYLPKGCDRCEPIIRTAPSRARRAAPFDRPEPIGWHGDFATYEDRPLLSIVYITRPDPCGAKFGAWRLASVARAITALCATPDGHRSFDLLGQEPLPFRYADDVPPRWFKVIETRPGGKLGLRFYLPSLRRGCIAEYGTMPPRIGAALADIERAADSVAEIVPTEKGSLLVASNWFALHDRTQQTISGSGSNREALLCFVARQKVAARADGPTSTVK